jgi:hypothetical protein
MPFLLPPGEAVAFEFWPGAEGVAVEDVAAEGVVACFRPAIFFSAAAVRSEGSGVGAFSGAVGSGVGEVSSGKVMLHVMSLETKKFSLAGR